MLFVVHVSVVQQYAVASGIEFVLLDFMYQSVTDPEVEEGCMMSTACLTR